MLSFLLWFLFIPWVSQGGFLAQHLLLQRGITVLHIVSICLLQSSSELEGNSSALRRWGIVPLLVLHEVVLWPKIMGEKQSRWHTAMAPHCFSLSKRLGTARPSSPSIGSVLGLMLYTPLHTWTAVFTSLCVSDAFAVAVSYYKKMRCFFFVCSVPSWSPQWALLHGISLPYWMLNMFAFWSPQGRIWQEQDIPSFPILWSQP